MNYFFFAFIYLIYQKSHGQNQSKVNSNFYEAPYLHILIVLILLYAACYCCWRHYIVKDIIFSMHSIPKKRLTERSIKRDKEKLHIVPSHSLEIFIIRVARYYIYILLSTCSSSIYTNARFEWRKFVDLIFFDHSILFSRLKAFTMNMLRWQDSCGLIMVEK